MGLAKVQGRGLFPSCLETRLGQVQDEDMGLRPVKAEVGEQPQCREERGDRVDLFLSVLHDGVSSGIRRELEARPLS